MKLALGNSTGKGNLPVAGIVTSDLKLLHRYDAGLVVPVSDGAAVFNGTSDYIAIGEKPVDTADATYCFWANSSVTAENRGVFGHGGSNVGAFNINHSSGGADKPLLYLAAGHYQYWDDNPAQDDGRWHHWAVVVDIDSMEGSKLYIDGVLQNQSSRVQGTATSYGNLEIGRSSSSYEYEGYLCNFGVWTGHLTQAQIKSIMFKSYADLTTSETTNLVSWWNLDSTIADYDTNNGYVLDNHGGLGPELIDLTASDDYSGTPAAGDWVVTGKQTATWTGANPGSGSAFEYLGEDLVNPTGSLENGEVYRLEFTIDDFVLHYSGTNTMGFSQTGSSDVAMFTSLRFGENKTASGTFVSNGSAIRVYGRQNMSAKVTISCKKVLGNPGDLT